MKVAQNTTEFRPFSITIEFDTNEEAGAVFSLFNHADLSRIVGHDIAAQITSAISSGNNGKSPEYMRFHKNICELVG